MMLTSYFMIEFLHKCRISVHIDSAILDHEVHSPNIGNVTHNIDTCSEYRPIDEIRCVSECYKMLLKWSPFRAWAL